MIWNRTAHVKTLQLLHRSDVNYSAMGIQRQTEEFQAQSKVIVGQCFPSCPCQWSIVIAICLLLGILNEVVLITDSKGKKLVWRDILVYNSASEIKDWMDHRNFFPSLKKTEYMQYQYLRVKELCQMNTGAEFLKNKYVRM